MFERVLHVGRQAYDEQRRRKDAEREAKEAAEEEAAARAEAERAEREDAEAAQWVGQISVEGRGEEAQTQEQAQARVPSHLCQQCRATSMRIL